MRKGTAASVRSIMFRSRTGKIGKISVLSASMCVAELFKSGKGGIFRESDGGFADALKKIVKRFDGLAIVASCDFDCFLRRATAAGLNKSSISRGVERTVGVS